MNKQNGTTPQARRKKILLVEDETESLEQLANLLKRENYEVVSAATGKDALILAASTRPDLVILDMILPDILGGEVSKRLSENADLTNIPIIFLTGLNTKEDEAIMKEKAGIYHLLAKPVTREELLEAITKALT